MDKELYLQILKDELQQTMEYTTETMGLRLDQLTFQHDDDSKHTAKAVQAYLQQSYEVLVWPSHSPDLNPIEHRRPSTTLLSLYIHWVIPRLVDQGVV
ncbi:hypothetical protein RMATCC62417_06907 [Rhizopus microsporus]|nr:hypothetical protein RMATCC62417_06907 [Rhizopus microsporus]